MEASSNVMQISEWTGTSDASFTSTGGDWNTTTITSPSWTWYPNYLHTYPVYQRDRVAELKAWLDGYSTDRKMTEKALKKIRAKIDEFTNGSL